MLDYSYTSSPLLEGVGVCVWRRVIDIKRSVQNFILIIIRTELLTVNNSLLTGTALGLGATSEEGRLKGPTNDQQLRQPLLGF